MTSYERLPKRHKQPLRAMMHQINSNSHRHACSTQPSKCPNLRLYPGSGLSL
ncbi:hypothetical protein BGZ61DRAFT_439083 [Ilyonectria robusta]|uniref:uncharacterized protein n=1 Tax=Ilyonectria robusta TaxID=1079257 RepID=UPI001E8D5CB3|nr:uncharacterized protein BGZ61DRAFT_439083 [Ilyonectria robusta]KAH8737826.1 hypothetical protein BGZ61DRAFT_439083 [Ilyonectria robusta]